MIYKHGWLTLTEFLEVIAIAEMTPGPMAVNTATFVGYPRRAFSVPRLPL